MARSLLDRLVGPLTPGRLGGVIGFVVGFAWPLVDRSYGNLAGVAATFVFGPVGAVLGVLFGRLYARLRRRLPEEPRDGVPTKAD